MWLRVVVVGVRAAGGGAAAAGAAAPRPGAKASAEVFLAAAENDAPPDVPDQSLAAFCLPLGPENQSPKEFMAPEEFSFTLTRGDGSRVQGFCRRFLPPAPRVGSKLRMPQVLCLVCEAAWSALFFKVLEVMEQLLRGSELLSDFSNRQLPAASDAGVFLRNLGAVLAQQPQLGAVIRVELPRQAVPLAMSPPKRIGGANTGGPLPLLLTEELIELQVPPDCGNGADNAGVSLARLLWHVPVPAMLTLIASLLLERRVLVVGQSRDMVSAAVCAAQALLHPFRWHHICLPLLPRSLSDYLTAPMPFLIGLPAQLLPALKHLPMDEVTLIDLDLGKCEPASGSARDDANLLPWRDQLEAALQAACGLLRSPTEMESNGLIASIMHGYFLKLVGSYRSHIYADGCFPGLPADEAAGLGGQQQLLQQPDPQQQQRGGGGGGLGRLSLQGLGSSHSSSSSAPAGGSRRQSRPSSSNIRQQQLDGALQAHGCWFDHQGLAASHRRNDKARNFLLQLRQSQLFEVFVRERLQMCADIQGGPEFSEDVFEQLVNVFLDNRSRRLSARLGAGVRSSLSRFGALIKKHRRTDSNQGWDAAGLASSSFSAALTRGRAGAAGLAERPEAVRMRQVVAAFAAAADQVRRNLTTDSGGRSLTGVPGHRHTTSAVGGGDGGGGSSLSDPCSSTALDPSSLFEDDDDDLDAAEAAEAAAAAATGHSSSSSPTRPAGLGRSSLSSNSLKDLAAGAGRPLVAASGASWSAGAGQSTRSGMLMQQQQQQQQGPSHEGLAGLGSSGAMPLAAAAGHDSLQERSASPQPLIDLSSDSSSSDRSLPEVHQQHPPQWPPHARSPRSPSGLGPIPRHPPAGGFGGGSSSSSGQRSTQQHINVKAALASIPAGPLPQPPKARAPVAWQQQHAASNGASVGALAASQPAVALGVASSAAADAPAAVPVWDPFSELITERMASSGSGLNGAQPPHHPLAVALTPGARSISSGSGADSFSAAELQLQAAGGTSSSSEGGASSCSVRGSLSGGGSVVELSSSRAEAALAHGGGILAEAQAQDLL